MNITAVEADLACTDKQTEPIVVLSGMEVTYTLTVTNKGSASATNVILTDMLPRGVTFASDMSDPRCTESSPGLVTCSLGTLDSDEIATVAIGGTVGDCIEENPIQNMAMVSSDDVPDPDFSNNNCKVRTLVEDKPFLGHFKVFAKGVGLNDPPSEVISLNIPDEDESEIIRAFLTWQRDVATQDKTITLDEALITGTASTDTAGGLQCLLADITERIDTGPQQYTVTVSPNPSELLTGAGILVIAEDESLPLQSIEVQRNFCDYFHHGTPGHENSEVITFQVDDSIAKPEAKVTLFVGDAQSNCPPQTVCRGNEILFLSDVGSPPSSLADDPRCTDLGHPPCISLGGDTPDTPPGLIANDGNFWDTFGRNSGSPPDPDVRGEVTIPPGAHVASFQVLSPADRNGVSAFVSMAAFEIALTTPPDCGPFK